MPDPTFDDQPILKSIKAALGLADDYAAFDFELTMHINSVLATLNQLGVGPDGGVSIEANTMWSALLAENINLNNARSYVFLRVKMLFDSSSMSQHVVAAYEKMILEQEVRLQMSADPMIPQLIPDTDEGDI